MGGVVNDKQRVIADSKNSDEFLDSTMKKKRKIIANLENSSEFSSSPKNKKKRFIADLQIHSRFARATSRNINIENLEKYARIKGIDLLGVGDFQHPEWRKEIDEKLTEDDRGILRTKTGFPFIWQTEVSLMFSDNGRRAVHLLIFAPNTRLADKITEYLGSKGRLDYDGRPIFGMTCRDLVKDLKEIDDMIEIIPAHCMTPWFGLFGSQSGFDSLEACFKDQTKHIYAIESGMSADPAMLWRFREVASGNVRVVSFSDAHSHWPWRLGREATIFEFDELSYENVIRAIRTGAGLVGTIETPPEYGKYHWDGHRNCDFSCSPAESKKLDKKCPKCGKGMVIGVDYRVEEVAHHDHGHRPEHGVDFHKLVPLHELIAFNFGGAGLATKKVWNLYNELIEKFGNEFRVLMDVSRDELLEKGFDVNLIELIMLNRSSELAIDPGYDGVYGRIQFSGISSREGFGEIKKSEEKQGTLF